MILVAFEIDAANQRRGLIGAYSQRATSETLRPVLADFLPFELVNAQLETEDSGGPRDASIGRAQLHLRTNYS